LFFFVSFLNLVVLFVACNQDEVNKAIESAQAAQRVWAKTPLWKRAETLHRFAGILKDQKNAIAEALVKEIAKPQKDSVTEVKKNDQFTQKSVLNFG